MEIFSHYGSVRNVDLGGGGGMLGGGRGGGPSPAAGRTATIEFESPDMVEKAVKHMEGGECSTGCCFTLSFGYFLHQV
jgi:hypothetical protein